MAQRLAKEAGIAIPEMKGLAAWVFELTAEIAEDAEMTDDHRIFEPLIFTDEH
jgi:hypothetical protein